MPERGFVVGDRVLQSADSHADWCAAFGQQGVYSFVAASAIGRLHLRDKRPRDDAFAVRAGGAWLAVAVSDGVGSREQSRYGASYAVEALCEHLLRAAPRADAPASVPAVPEANAAEDPARTALPFGGEDSACPRRSRGAEMWQGLGRRWQPLRHFLGSGFRAHHRAPVDRDAAEDQAPGITMPRTSGVPRFHLDPHAVMAPPPAPATACGTLTWHGHCPGAAATDAAALSPATVIEAFERTRQGLEQFALTRGATLQEYSCTLLGLLLNTETGAAVVGHIGDGLIAARHPRNGMSALVEAPAPGDAGGVYTITGSDWAQKLSTRALSPAEMEGFTMFYLMTDGVAEDCTHPPPEDVLQRWAEDVEREVRTEEPLSRTATQLLHWLATYEASGSWDDRTLVLVFPAPEHGTGRLPPENFDEQLA